MNILYIMNNYSGNNFAFWDGLYCPENLQYEYQSQIINKLLEYPHKITIKLHPNPNYKNPPMINELPKRVRIIRDACSAVELLSSADLVILDYACTTLLQALKAGKRILLFNPVSIDIKELVGRTVGYAEKIDDFLGLMESHL